MSLIHASDQYLWFNRHGMSVPWGPNVAKDRSLAPGHNRLCLYNHHQEWPCRLLVCHGKVCTRHCKTAPAVVLVSGTKRCPSGTWNGKEGLQENTDRLVSSCPWHYAPLSTQHLVCATWNCQKFPALNRRVWLHAPVPSAPRPKVYHMLSILRGLEQHTDQRCTMLSILRAWTAHPLRGPEHSAQMGRCSCTRACLLRHRALERLHCDPPCLRAYMLTVTCDCESHPRTLILQ